MCSKACISLVMGHAAKYLEYVSWILSPPQSFDELVLIKSRPT